MKLTLRVDFAGGWLDVPRFAVPGAYIVNCAISPLVHLVAGCDEVHIPPAGVATKALGVAALSWESGVLVPSGSGLGSSAAWHMLNGRDALAEELASGAGWQDPAIIRETGLCVWASGPVPVLVHRDSGDWLRGLMAIHWTGKSHCTADIASKPRDYTAIANASVVACKAVMRKDAEWLSHAMRDSSMQQVDEGMERLSYVPYFMGRKYCGASHGGYAVYLFDSQERRDRAVRKHGMMAVEPYCKESAQ